MGKTSCNTRCYPASEPLPDNSSVSCESVRNSQTWKSAPCATVICPRQSQHWQWDTSCSLGGSSTCLRLKYWSQWKAWVKKNKGGLVLFSESLRVVGERSWRGWKERWKEVEKRETSSNLFPVFRSLFSSTWAREKERGGRERGSLFSWPTSYLLQRYNSFRQQWLCTCHR